MLAEVRKLGEYKTIEQRERGRRQGAGRRRRGSANMWIGGLTYLATGPKGAAQSRVIQEPIRRGRVTDPSGRMVYHFRGAGDRVKASAKLATHLPHGSVRLLGAGAAMYGAGQYVTGRGQQHYNDAKLREQRRANMARQKKPVKKNLSFGGGATVGHREPVEKAGLTAATAASSVVRAGRRPQAAAVGRKVTPTAIPSLASLGGRRTVAKVNRALSPEARRQRRLGAEVASGVITGGLLTRRGIRSVAGRTSELRTRGSKLGEVLMNRDSKIVHTKHKKGQEPEEIVQEVTGTHREAAMSPNRMIATPNRREAAYIGGGAALTGVSVGAGHRARRQRNGVWY